MMIMISLMKTAILLLGINNNLVNTQQPNQTDPDVMVVNVTLLWNYRPDKGLNGTTLAHVCAQVEANKVYLMRGYSPIKRAQGYIHFTAGVGEHRIGDYDSEDERQYRKTTLGWEPEIAALLPDNQGYVMMTEIRRREIIRSCEQFRYSINMDIVDANITATTVPMTISCWDMIERRCQLL